MKQIFSDKEIKETLKRICVLCDTREQRNEHIVEYFQKRNIPYQSKKINTGDYSFSVDNMDFSDEVVVEKKKDLDEIAGNFTVGRNRFENEFLRAKAHGIKIFLLIENSSWQDIKSHNYVSRLSPKALMASLLAWQARYGITIIFCRSSESAEIIYATFYYWLKERLENGGLCYKN